MKSKHFWIIFAIAAAMRAWGIWLAPLWYDEAFSYLVGKLPLVQLIAATAGDVHPPLHYLTIAPFAMMGIPWLIRVPSLLFSMAALWVWWQILKEYSLPVLQETIGVLLMAVIPFQLYYAQEGRMYALLIMLVLASYWMLITKRWGWFGLASALLLWTHNYGMFYLPALWVVGMLRDWRAWRPLTTALALAGLSYLPWVWVLAQQMADVQRGYWIPLPTIGSVVYVVFSLFGPFTIPAWAGLPVVIALLLLVMFSPTFIQRPPLDILAMAVIPLTLAVVMSFVWRPVLLFRGLAGSAPFVMWLAFLPLASFKLRWQQAIGAVLVVPFLAVGWFGMYTGGTNSKGGEPLNKFNTVVQPGDTIYHIGDDTYITATANRPDLHNVRVQPCGHDNGGLSVQTREAMGFRYAEADQINGWLYISLVPLSNACNFALADTLVGNLDPTINLLAPGEESYLMRGLYKKEQ